jgi:hypothetical protein
METIFRVQDKEGCGPWRPGFSHNWVISRADHDNLIPWYVEHPGLDLNSLESGHFGTGCETIKQLKRWFTKREYEKIYAFGYRAVGVSGCEILASSDIQCVFKREIPLNINLSRVRLY